MASHQPAQTRTYRVGGVAIHETLSLRLVMLVIATTCFTAGFVLGLVMLSPS